MTEERILEIWKTILSRRALLWSTVEFRDYYDVHFVYVHSRTSRRQPKLMIRVSSAEIGSRKIRQNSTKSLDQEWRSKSGCIRKVRVEAQQNRGPFVLANCLASLSLTDILNDYLNGRRTLSNDRLAQLVISTPEGSLSSEDGAEQEFDFFLYRFASLPYALSAWAVED